MTEEAQSMLWILQMHVREMSARLRQIPENKWDCTFAPPAPTPRIVAVPTWQWLKNGQLSTLYFALGLDGDAPYAAPFPNPIYAELHAALHKDQANAS
jgi:hypothetical protein